VTTSLPTSFNAPGDVAIAYDLQFTNPTASYIKSAAPLTIAAGEIFNSSNLNLQTYNSGNIIADTQYFAIGTQSAAFKLDVTAQAGATAAAQIWNSFPNAGNGACANSQCHTGLSIKLGVDGSGGQAGSADRFINFAIGNGTIAGKVRGNGTGGVVFDTAGGDYAEWFRKENPGETFDYGAVVCLTSNGGVTHCSGANTRLLGVISNSVGFVGNSKYENDPNFVLVGILGQVETKVNSQNGEVRAGDLITYSGETGVASKATKAGYVLGRVLTSLAPGKVSAYINPSWYDPDVYITSSGDFNIQKSSDEDPVFSLVKTDGNTLVDRIGSFADIVAARIKSGRVETTKLEAVDASISGRIKVAALEVSGDVYTEGMHARSATVSGTLTADKIRANSIELSQSGWQDALASGGLSVISQELDGTFESKLSASNKFALLNDQIASISAEVQNVVETLENVNFAGFPAGTDLVSVDNLMVAGTTTLAEASILNQLSVGNDLVITGSSINTNSGTLEIQPFAQGDVSFEGGKVTIDTQGNLHVEGNAEFAGDVTVGGVLSAKDVAVERASVPQIISDTEIIATGSSALVTLNSGQTELKVNNTAAKAGSLIFLTPTTEADLPIYIKSQANGVFTVGIKEEQLYDIKFNFLIVN
jgi:hypothetical protein